MATSKFLSFLIVQLFLVLEVANSPGVEVGFYRKTCPNVEAIVKETTKHYISIAPTLAAPLLRMHLHDCFVRGCDGSVLLNSTNGNQVEKDAIPNQSLRGFQVIDAAKSALEKECPGTISCSDILALAACDAVSLTCISPCISICSLLASCLEGEELHPMYGYFAVQKFLLP
ncbi:peroxidase 27-like [Lycium barbarum]|uniref:peroxidase 27-like n=1 Tax=Lycium barbarum TaxID=112863 RepID=UPI00293E1695|nr:peroxidase 27-like [Lycium barbarum]